MAAWKDDFLMQYDVMDAIILQLAAGNPDLIRDYRCRKTHTELAEAYIAKLITI